MEPTLQHRGADAVIDAVSLCRFPATNRDLLEQAGNPEIAVDTATSCRLAAVLQALPRDSFSSILAFERELRSNWSQVLLQSSPLLPSAAAAAPVPRRLSTRTYRPRRRVRRTPIVRAWVRNHPPPRRRPAGSRGPGIR